eukprot:GSChrysophyteH1.ASY1.ANO1.1104.1 assembled CDS
MPLEGLVLRQQVVQDEVAPSDSDINSTSATSSEGTREDPCLSSHRHRSCCTWWDRLAWLRDMYSGLTPALLLCANPAIHYTIYDYMKLKILNRRLNVRNHAAISMATQQAFLVGIAAKAVATFVTFPLLRAKVLMMTGKGTLEMESLNENITASPDNGNIFTERFMHWLRTSDVGRLVSILMSICRLQGVRGLYTGFFLHIFHTTLRGATSMSLKEFFLKALSSSQVRTAASRTR